MCYVSFGIVVGNESDGALRMCIVCGLYFSFFFFFQAEDGIRDRDG